MKTIQQITTAPNGGSLLLVSEHYSEDDTMSDTKVYHEGVYIGSIHGGDILDFMSKIFKGYAKQNAVAYEEPKDVISEFLI